MVFFFQCSAELGVFHSFPTRRSSDLFECCPKTRAWMVRRALRVSAQLTTRSPSRDRKSTRLNSSHANISYAVFCLKKKTNHPHATIRPAACFPLNEHSPISHQTGNHL